MAMKEFLGVTRALRNPSRVKIMKLLQQNKESCVSVSCRLSWKFLRPAYPSISAF